MEFDSKQETEIYKKIQDFIKTLPLEQPWRGVMALNILNGFLDTAMSSQQENPHEVMAALDHMFVQMIEVYKSGGNTEGMFKGIEEFAELDEADRVDQELSKQGQSTGSVSSSPAEPSSSSGSPP